MVIPPFSHPPPMRSIIPHRPFQPARTNRCEQSTRKTSRVCRRHATPARSAPIPCRRFQGRKKARRVVRYLVSIGRAGKTGASLDSSISFQRAITSSLDWAVGWPFYILTEYGVHPYGVHPYSHTSILPYSHTLILPILIPCRPPCRNLPNILKISLRRQSPQQSPQQSPPVVSLLMSSA